jgi:hypothetical protein
MFLEEECCMLKSIIHEIKYNWRSIPPFQRGVDDDGDDDDGDDIA